VRHWRKVSTFFVDGIFKASEFVLTAQFQRPPILVVAEDLTQWPTTACEKNGYAAQRGAILSETILS
jgi:hypothetical protein